MKLKKSDHDLLLEIKTHVEYIREDIKEGIKERAILTKLTDNTRNRIEAIEGRMKVWVGIATFIGGAIVWIVDKGFDFFSNK